jgi:hypothetical protein
VPPEVKATAAPTPVVEEPAAPEPAPEKPVEETPEPAPVPEVTVKPAVSSVAGADGNIIVTLNKAGGKKLGLELNQNYSLGRSLAIAGVGPQGLAAEYNASCKGDKLKELKPGCVIVKVNDTWGSPAELVQAISNQEKLDIEMKPCMWPTWEVVITKSRLAKAGLKLDPIKDSDHFKISGFEPNSPADKFNKENKKKAMAVGDILMAINGETTSTSVVTSTESIKGYKSGDVRPLKLPDIMSKLATEGVFRIKRES